MICDGCLVSEHLQDLDLFCLGPFLALGDAEADLLAFRKGSEPIPSDGALQIKQQIII